MHERITRLRQLMEGVQQQDDPQPRTKLMEYLEWLRKGSEHHVASPTKEGFTIEAADDTAECMQRFQEIVETAIANAASAYYVILPHAASGRWDRAAIIPRRPTDPIATAA